MADALPVVHALSHSVVSHCLQPHGLCPTHGWMDGGGWWDGGWMDGWINSMGSTHTVDYDRAMKRSEALTRDTTWMDLAHTMLTERSRRRRTHRLSLLGLP